MLDDDFRFVLGNSISQNDGIAKFELSHEDVDPAAMDVVGDIENNLIVEELIKEEPIKDESISNVLYYCRERNMNLFPYEFKDSESFDVYKFINFAKKFTWIILDWNIPDQTQIYNEVIKTFGSDKRLRFITIYTDSDDLNPIKESIFKIAKEFNFNLDSISEENSLYQIGSIIIFLQQKTECELSKLLDTFSLTMLDNFGELFLAILQYSQVIEEKSSEVLMKTTNPFKILALMQVLKNDTTQEGFNKELNKVISENILAFASLPVETTEYIKENIINHIKEYTKKMTVIKDCCECYQGKETKPKFITSYTDDMLSDILKDSEIDKLFEYFNNMNFSALDKPPIQFTADLLTNMSFKNSVYPNLLDCIILGSLKPNDTMIDLKKHYGEALLKLLEFTKYDKYSEDEVFEERLDKGGIELDNLFSIGDVFELKDRKRDYYEYLLCITPECDTLRLSSSINERVTFIPGHVISWRDYKKHIENNNKYKQYVSLLPCCNKKGEHIVPVEWDFYSVHMFNLKSKEDKERVKRYKRYYNMRYEYTKQIQSKFISYFLRNGVDELFIKDKNVSFGDMLIDMIM